MSFSYRDVSRRDAKIKTFAARRGAIFMDGRTLVLLLVCAAACRRHAGRMQIVPVTGVSMRRRGVSTAFSADYYFHGAACFAHEETEKSCAELVQRRVIVEQDVIDFLCTERRLLVGQKKLHAQRT
jgi:hypothetical protein